MTKISILLSMALFGINFASPIGDALGVSISGVSNNSQEPSCLQAIDSMEQRSSKESRTVRCDISNGEMGWRSRMLVLGDSVQLCQHGKLGFGVSGYAPFGGEFQVEINLNEGTAQVSGGVGVGVGGGATMSLGASGPGNNSGVYQKVEASAGAGEGGSVSFSSNEDFQVNLITGAKLESSATVGYQSDPISFGSGLCGDDPSPNNEKKKPCPK